MERCPQHIFQILTKRPHITRSYIRKRYSGNAPPAHIWLGISAERQKEADERIPLLLRTPAVVRFISAEPLLGPIDLSEWIDGLSWIIVGGESGVKHPRPMNPEWARDIRDQCEESGVAFFFKQWGGIRPKSGGKVLDGREWCDFPQC